MEAEIVYSEILKLCHHCHAQGFVSGSGGNISFRIEDDVLITPTGRNLGHLKRDDLVRMRCDGTAVGMGSPSKEWRMHLGCYQRESVACVIHVHSLYAVAVSCSEHVDPECAMPVYTPGYAVRVGMLPMVPYFKPGSEELSEVVAAVIKRRNSVLLANHGVLAVGATPEQAINLIEEIEENAHLTFILGGKGLPLKQSHLEGLVQGY